MQATKQKIIRLPVVLERTGLTRSTLYRYIAANQFPGQVRLGIGSVGWIESDVDEWISVRQPAKSKEVA